MKSNVFYDGLNEFCRTYLIQGINVTPAQVGQFQSQKLDVEATLFENLLLFDKASLKVYGENIPLALLLNLFGEKGFEELLDQNALDFVLWTPMIGAMVDDIPGVDPLVFGAVSSKAHSDPEKSIELGFNWMKQKPKRSTRRMLIRKVRDLYRMPDNALSGDAVKMANSAYSSGRLDAYGFDSKNQDIRKLEKAARQRLCTCATDLLEYNYLISSQMTSFSKREFYDFFAQTQSRLKTAEDKAAAFCKISKLEEFPDLKKLCHQLESPFGKLISVRKKNSSAKFREWLDQASGDEKNSQDIAKEYIDAIAHAKGFFHTAKGKITKTVVLNSIGAGIGAAIAGLPGAAVAAGVSQLLQPAADFALDMVDQFLIEGLTKGWTPRIFVDDLRKLQTNSVS